MSCCGFPRSECECQSTENCGDSISVAELESIVKELQAMIDIKKQKRHTSNEQVALSPELLAMLKDFQFLAKGNQQQKVVTENVLTRPLHKPVPHVNVNLAKKLGVPG